MGNVVERGGRTQRGRINGGLQIPFGARQGLAEFSLARILVRSPAQDVQDAIQLGQNCLAIGVGHLRVLEQFGAIGLESFKLDFRVLHLPALVIDKLLHAAIGLPLPGNQVLALQLPADERPILRFGPPLLESIRGGDALHRQTDLGRRLPVGAKQPGEVTLEKGFVQAILGEEGGFLCGGDLDAQHVARHIAWRRLGDDKDGNGDQEHGQEHEEQPPYNEFGHLLRSFA